MSLRHTLNCHFGRHRHLWIWFYFVCVQCIKIFKPFKHFFNLDKKSLSSFLIQFMSPSLIPRLGTSFITPSSQMMGIILFFILLSKTNLPILCVQRKLIYIIKLHTADEISDWQNIVHNWYVSALEFPFEVWYIQYSWSCCIEGCIVEAIKEVKHMHKTSMQ